MRSVGLDRFNVRSRSFPGFLRGTESAVKKLFALSPHPVASRRVLRVFGGSCGW